MIDSNLKPWLMEVNVCPSLNIHSRLDEVCKTTLVCDTMNLLGYQPFDWEYFDVIKRDQKLKRKYHRRAYGCQDLVDLNSDNCIEKLSVEDFQILFEFEEEYYRRGNFERLFPNRDNVKKYS